MKELMKKRQQTFRTQCVKYSRYVLNDHFVLFMLIFIGFLAVQYSQFLQDLPKDTSLIRWSLMIGLLLLVPIGSIATYLEKPDALFLLVKEEEVKRYIKGQAKKSFVFWFLIQSFVLLLFVPLLLATGLDKLAIVAYILVLGVAKGAVFSWKEARFYQDGNLNWSLAIARENARKQLILRFFALFTTVKSLLGWFLRVSSQNTWEYLALLIYALLLTEWRSFLYDSTTLGSFHSCYHLYSPASRSDCPCSLAQLLGYFSITGALQCF